MPTPNQNPDPVEPTVPETTPETPVATEEPTVDPTPTSDEEHEITVPEGSVVAPRVPVEEVDPDEPHDAQNPSDVKKAILDNGQSVETIVKAEDKEYGEPDTPAHYENPNGAGVEWPR